MNVKTGGQELLTRIKFRIVFGIIIFVSPATDLKTQNNIALVASVQRV